MKNRSEYFHHRANAVLYGSQESPRRWWAKPPEGALYRGLSVDAMEVLTPTDGVGGGLRGYLVLHLRLSNDVLRDVASVASIGGATFATDEGAIRELTYGVCELPVMDGDHAQRVFTITYARFLQTEISEPFDMRSDVPPRSRWLFALAAATNLERFQPDGDQELPPETSLSASWRCMVLRDGAAFIGKAGRDYFLDDGSAEALVRTIYCDALVLGLMQVDSVTAIADSLVDISGGRQIGNDLRKAQFWLDEVRTHLWWEHITSHGAANEILVAFQRQRSSRELLEQVIDELNSRVNLYKMIQDDRTNLLLSVIAIVGLPFSVGIGLAQIVLEHGVAAGSMSFGVSGFLTAVVAGAAYLFMRTRGAR